MKRWLRLVLLCMVLVVSSACTPEQVQRWLDLHGIGATAEQVKSIADSFDAPPGWVDLGHGIWGPEVLVEIRRCESGGDYSAQNPSSSASGAYQFLRSSWAWYGHEARYGAPVAANGLPWQQDEAAVLTMMRDGTRPWNASRHCWSGFEALLE